MATTKTKVRKAIRAVLKSVHRDLLEATERLLKSGGIDVEGYDNDVLAAKVLVKAALRDEHEHFALPDYPWVKRDVNNLRHF